MPAAFIAANPVSSGQGVYEIQIAPSNSNIMYMMFNGYVFVSTNKGTTWSQTSFAQVTADPNDNYAKYGQKMAIDPNNPNIVYVGTEERNVRHDQWWHDMDERQRDPRTARRLCRHHRHHVRSGDRRRG